MHLLVTGCNGLHTFALQRNAAALISACLESSDSAIQAAIEARVVSEGACRREGCRCRKGLGVTEGW